MVGFKQIPLLVVILFAFKVLSVFTTNSCWNANAGGPSDSPTETLCQNTLTYGSGFRSTNWPTWTLLSVSTCTASTNVLCSNAAIPAPSTIANSPTVASCYAGSSLTAAQLTTQASTACPSPSYFCKAEFSSNIQSSTVTVTSSCLSTQCTASDTVLCSIVANTNQVLGCYVGVYYTTGGTTTFSRQICVPASGVSASFCQNDYTWSSTNLYTVTGSCVTSCNAIAISLTGTVSTTGTTCSSSVYGNSFNGITTTTTTTSKTNSAMVNMAQGSNYLIILAIIVFYF